SYVPSIAVFRYGWLRDKISVAYTAALVFEAAPGVRGSDDAPNVSDGVAKQILDSIGAHSVAMKMGQRRRLLASSDTPPLVSQHIDMRDMSWHRAVIDSFETLISADNDVMLVVGDAPMGGEF